MERTGAGVRTVTSAPCPAGAKIWKGAERTGAGAAEGKAAAIDPSIGTGPLYKGGRRGRSSETWRQTSERSGAGADAGDGALVRSVG